jgi:hypothetical protein
MQQLLIGLAGFVIFSALAALFILAVMYIQSRREREKMSPGWMTGQLRVATKVEMRHELVGPDGTRVATSSDEGELRALKAAIDRARGGGQEGGRSR